MPRIVDEVRRGHLSKYPTEQGFLTPFLPLFDITRAASHTDFNTNASVYFLKPAPHTKQTFGFERELLLAYSPYPRFEPRLAQLVDRVMTRVPARGRVESLCYVVVADDLNIREGVTEITTSSVEAKTIVAFTRAELDAQPDQWFVRNRLAQNLFSRDLFDISQALVEDTYFFGRQALVRDLLDRFKRGQNTGLFGLRKSGKTSLISKLRRIITTSMLGTHVALDAQDPAIYKQRWWQLLGTIVERVADETLIQPQSRLDSFSSPDSAPGAFAASLNYIFSRLPTDKARLLLIIDELEHICPGLSLEAHWNEDFIPFCQTLRAYQARVLPKFSCLVAGVNPRPVEQTKWGNHDNPLFGLIPRTFVPPFTRSEVRDMVRTLGRYMGMKFEEDTFDYLRFRYGGHPMLIRLASSWIHKHLITLGNERPLEVSRNLLTDTEQQRDSTLAPYARHILDVLTSWYPLEYEMLEMLALGHDQDYQELAEQDPQLLEHLRGYGLISTQSESNERAMIFDFVKRQARPSSRVAPSMEFVGDRETVRTWTVELEQLSDAVVYSRTYCQEIAQMLSLDPIFSDDKLRLGARLADLRVAPLSQTRSQFENTINTLQQLFGDAVSHASKTTLSTYYPSLSAIINKIRCLRHYFHHPDLHDPAVREVAIQLFQTEIGSFPTTESDWAKLHVGLMRELVKALKDTQSRMFVKS